MCDTQEWFKIQLKNMEKLMDDVRGDIKWLTDTVTQFMMDMKETNITRKEAEEKFTQKQSFRVAIGIVWALATIIWFISMTVK